MTTTTRRALYASNAASLIPRIVAPTTDLKTGMLKIQAVSRADGIIAIDGVPGTGKTTCAAIAAVKLGRPYAMVRLSHKPSPLELLRRIHAALTGLDDGQKATRLQLQDDIVLELVEWHGLLIVDELQNAAVNAFQELTWLYEQSGKTFSIAAVGTGVLNAITNYPQLESRVMSSHTFFPLNGPDLISAVRNLDPRFQSASVADLSTHDQKACAGNLRRWVQTVNWMDALDVSGTADDALLANIRNVMGTHALPGTRSVKSGGR